MTDNIEWARRAFLIVRGMGNTPWWHFWGMVVLGVGFIVFMMEYQDRKHQVQRLTNKEDKR